MQHDSGARQAFAKPRRLLSDDAEVIATSIAERLDETDAVPREQIRRIVRRIGPVRAAGFLQEALNIEARGGMTVNDGNRRRTPGGTYFHLVRGRISAHDRYAIWRSPRQQRMAHKRARNHHETATSLRTATPTWAERSASAREVALTPGAMTKVKTTLIGRPSLGAGIREHASYIITAMQPMKIPALPKGLPTPPALPTYTVYIARKQWNKVVEALEDPEDELIVDGYATLDEESQTIAVFAQNTTTKRLQAASRARSEERG